MRWFSAIRVLDSDVNIDTYDVRRKIYARANVSGEPRLVVRMEMVMRWGYGGIKRNVVIEFPPSIQNELQQLVRMAIAYRTVRLEVIGDEGRRDVIRLEAGIPEQFEGVQTIMAGGTLSESLVKTLDKISERIEGGAYRIKWAPSMGKQQTYYPEGTKRRWNEM